MRPFRFRLESVKRLRGHAEQQAREGLAVELAVRQERAVDHEKSVSALADARAAARVADPATAAAWALFVERRDRERRTAAAALALQETRVEDSRRVAVDASRERKVVDRLEERHRAEHRAQAGRALGAQLDELALAMHARSGRKAA